MILTISDHDQRTSASVCPQPEPGGRLSGPLDDRPRVDGNGHGPTIGDRRRAMAATVRAG
jgi:hypothetical protein